MQVGNKTLKAHRCILGQHSEVFRSMFAQESMLEAQKGIIDIQDSRFEPVSNTDSFLRSSLCIEVFSHSNNFIVSKIVSNFKVRAMVDYIYTGSTDLVEGYAEDVLAIADKYAILPLKEQCERYLSTTINCKNVASTAVFADTYSASILKQVRTDI